MDTPSRSIDVSDLRRVHERTTHLFPHEYLDKGLGAIGLFLHNPPRNARYQASPLNSVTFASLGVDGIHLGSVTDAHAVDPMAPVVLTIPMSFDVPNFIVGESLYDFLCLGCRHGYSNLANLHRQTEVTLNAYQNVPESFFDERAADILQTLSDELLLVPWPDVRGHFEDLQSRHLSMLRLRVPS